MESITATGWHLVQEFYENRRPSTLQAAAGCALSEGAAASAPACGAYSRPHESKKFTGPGNEDGLLEGLKGRRGGRCFVDGVFSATVTGGGLGARQGELQQATAGGPFTKIHVDLTGPHVRSKNGFVYLLTAVNDFTKYLTCVSIWDKSALSVAKALVKQVYLLFGCLILQISDMGGEFQNDVMRNIADLLGIQLNRRTVYRPSSNGAVEPCKSHNRRYFCLNGRRESKELMRIDTIWDLRIQHVISLQYSF